MFLIVHSTNYGKQCIRWGRLGCDKTIREFRTLLNDFVHRDFLRFDALLLFKYDLRWPGKYPVISAAYSNYHEMYNARDYHRLCIESSNSLAMGEFPCFLEIFFGNENLRKWYQYIGTWFLVTTIILQTVASGYEIICKTTTIK